MSFLGVRPESTNEDVEDSYGRRLEQFTRLSSFLASGANRWLHPELIDFDEEARHGGSTEGREANESRESLCREHFIAVSDGRRSCEDLQRIHARMKEDLSLAKSYLEWRKETEEPREQHSLTPADLLRLSRLNIR